MQDLKTRFTALGMSNSGKTCYILGMYHKMVEGVRGWTITTENAKADKIARQLKIIDDNTKGIERFPSGTNDTVFVDYEFKLHFRNQNVMSFNWIDYAGGILENSSLNHSTYSSLEQHIKKSTALYIFIDGELFCGSDKKRKTKRVRRECSDYINCHITGFLLEHEGEIPPIVFIVTKADLCKNDTNINEIVQILKENFSSIFLSPKSLIYIVPVSLGNDLTINEYAGDIDPVNTQIPFFIGIYHEFLKCFLHLTEENGSFILQHEGLIENCKSIIRSHEQNINRIKQLISNSQQTIKKMKKEVSDLELTVKKINRK